MNFRSPVITGTYARFVCIYRNVVVAGGVNLRYTPQVRGSQRSYGFPWVSGSHLRPADAVVQRY